MLKKAFYCWKERVGGQFVYKTHVIQTKERKKEGTKGSQKQKVKKTPILKGSSEDMPCGAPTTRWRSRQGGDEGGMVLRN